MIEAIILLVLGFGMFPIIMYLDSLYSLDSRARKWDNYQQSHPMTGAHYSREEWNYLCPHLHVAEDKPFWGAHCLSDEMSRLSDIRKEYVAMGINPETLPESQVRRIKDSDGREFAYPIKSNNSQMETE